MTPFGHHIRKLRRERKITLKKMALDLQVSPPYLSALEHGKRGRPGPGFVMQSQIILNLFGMKSMKLKSWLTCLIRECLLKPPDFIIGLRYWQICWLAIFMN